MIRALFYTTQTADCLGHVKAWESAFGSAKHVTYNHRGVCNDWELLSSIQEYRPQVVFYIGAHQAPGNPKPATLIEARKLTKMVNFCSDAGDRPWHDVLRVYRSLGCFDLQVAIDGAMRSPVDMATLTPVDPRLFQSGEMEKTIRCGFSGTVGRCSIRSETVLALSWFGGLTLRHRQKDTSYADHARFLRRCRMVLNVSRTGSGSTTHVKGRVLEAGLAGACLLEDQDSPIGEWFPEDCYILYHDPRHAAELIKRLSDAEIERTAKRLTEEVLARFTPKLIYNAILEKLGLVAPAQPIQAA